MKTTEFDFNDKKVKYSFGNSSENSEEINRVVVWGYIQEDGLTDPIDIKSREKVKEKIIDLFSKLEIKFSKEENKFEFAEER